MVVALLWVYYQAQILLVGGHLTKVRGEHRQGDPEGDADETTDTGNVT